MTDERMSTLERAWAVLTPPQGDQLSSYPLGISFADRLCRVALDASGARHVLIPVANEAVQADKQPSVLELSVRSLVFDADISTYVDLSCGDRDLFAEFDDVVTDVLEAAQESERPGSAAVRAIRRWRRLFRSHLVRGLSYQARLGLFAELSVLSALLDVDPHLPVDVWRGPLREPHDIEAPRHCLEIKALGDETDAITVHGLSQLDVHDERPLDLVLIEVLEDPAGVTLTDLIEQVRKRVESRTDLRQRLTAAGWSSSPAIVDTQPFVIGEVRSIPVAGAVPRLTAGDLTTGTAPSGVKDLRYSVDVAALVPHASSASLAQIAQEACR